MTIAVMAGALIGCGNNADNTAEPNNTTENNVQDDAQANNGSSEQAAGNTNESTAASDNRIGLGVVSVLEKTTNAGDTDGSAEVSTVIAAVTVDGEDRITDCSLDMIEHVIPVSNTGAFAASARTEYQTKKELGTDYGMKAASGIGKEWYEQAEAFENYAIGKTVEEIHGIETDSNGYIQDGTLNTSVTISISDFQAAISKAVENAS